MLALASLRFAFYYLITYGEYKKQNTEVHVFRLHKYLKFYAKTPTSDK